MDKVHVIGRIFPSAARFSIRSPALRRRSSETGLQAEYQVSVRDSLINAECHLEKYDPEHLPAIVNGAYDYARTLVNLIGFARGFGISIVFEYAIVPDGTLAPIVPRTPQFDSICTAYRLEDDSPAELVSVVNMVLSDTNLYLAFNDLIDTQIVPHVSLINSGRVIEAIRRMIAPDIKEKPAWAAMHRALNVSRSYLEWITNQSKGPRHADRSETSVASQLEATERAWIIMNRYLEYRKRGDHPLAGPEFPELV